MQRTTALPVHGGARAIPDDLVEGHKLAVSNALAIGYACFRCQLTVIGAASPRLSSQNGWRTTNSPTIRIPQTYRSPDKSLLSARMPMPRRTRWSSSRKSRPVKDARRQK
jgi:hypothetical protein